MRRATLILCALLCMASRHPDRMIRADLALNASFNRGDASDRSIYNHTPTLNNGAVITAGNRYMTLDGSNDYLSFPDAAGLSFGNAGADKPFSVSCWVNLASYSSSAITFLVSKGTPTKYEWAFALNYGSTSTQGPGFFLYNAAASAYVARARNSRFSTTGAWTHFVATYSGGKTTGSIKLYQSGVQIDNTNVSAGSYAGLTDNNGQVEIGAWEAAGPLNGSIDDARIYSRELSAAEVAAIYSSGRE